MILRRSTDARPLSLHAARLVVLVVVGLAGASCSTPSARTPIELPEIAAAADPIAALDFLTGRWVAVNPNGTVNEEVWTRPRGNAQIGTFRQVRRDGDCAFVEISQIAVDASGEVLLRQRHLHGKLEVPAGRAEISVFRLVTLAPLRVEFAGTGAAAQVTSVTYERTAADELVQSVGFDPSSGEKPFVTRYRLDVDRE